MAAFTYPPMFKRSSSVGRSSAWWLERVEWVVLAVAVAGIGALHVVNLRRAGPLWRDEIGDVIYASMPSWKEIWVNLKYDNFPPGLLVVLRGWHALGWASTDAGYRVMGLLIGLGIVGAFFLNARLLGGRLPWFSLGLFAVNGLAVRVGDSVRPYGLGWLGILLTFGLLWRVVRNPRPGWRELVPVAGTALLAVQCLYQDAFLLLAMGVAGMIVSARAGRWLAVAAVAMVGGLAAGSLLPYALGPVRDAGAWSMISRTGLTWGRLRRMAWAAPGPDGSWLPMLWVGAVGVMVGVGVVWAWRKGGVERFRAVGGREGEAERAHAAGGPPALQIEGEALLYVGLAAGLGVPIFVGFLKGLGMTTSTWYYLPPMALVASALDAAGGVLKESVAGRWGRLAFLALTLALAVPDAWRAVNVRVTNADLVAERIARLAGPEDLVVVYPWPCGVSFQYYYRGSAPWSTVPTMTDNSIHRFDLMKQAMQSPDGVQLLLDRIEATLRGGHRVWTAGWINNAPPPGFRLPAPKPAPDPRLGWNEVAYLTIWAVQVRDLIRAHAEHSVPVEVRAAQRVNPTEEMLVYGSEGWKP